MPVLHDPDILFTAEYSETKERADITVDHSGEPYDPEKTDNTLSLTLVKSAAHRISCETTDHETRKNRIRIRLNSQSSENS